MTTAIFPDRFPAPLAQIWDLASAVLIADTHTSLVYRATRDDTSSVIVKHLKPEGERERSGFAYLRWRAGSGTVRILAEEANCCLLEDAGRETLASFQRAHGDVAASDVLLSVIPQLHAPSPASVPHEFLALESEFSALFAMSETIAHHDGGVHREIVGWALPQAAHLLANQTLVQPLHGDLHHDNVLRDDEGEWRAIDPRGLIGDPVYDTSNVFGNPLGAGALIVSPERILRLARDFGALLDCTPDKVLRFAAVRAVLSAAWSLQKPEADGAQQNIDERLAFATVARGLLQTAL